MHWLYRQHSIPKGNDYVKDISRLGWDLGKTIIVDNVADNFQLQIENGIYIKSWFGDNSDTALKDLGRLLKQISLQNLDVRVALKTIWWKIFENLDKGAFPDLSPWNLIT